MAHYTLMRLTNLVFSAILMLAAALTTFGVPAAFAQKTIFDVDLTLGNVGGGIVSGGIWDGGWRVVNEATDRIVFDAGYKIAAGYIETTLTINDNPIYREKKINYFGGYEFPHLSQGDPGDKFYLRTGRTNYDFSQAKGAGGPITKPLTVLGNGPVPSLEDEMGTAVTWFGASNDTTELTVKIEWKEGDQVNFFANVPAGSLTAPVSVFENYPLDEIRYAFLGGDRTYNTSLVGARFLRFKMVDYNAVPEPTTGTLLLIGCGMLAGVRRCRPSARARLPLPDSVGHERTNQQIL